MDETVVILPQADFQRIAAPLLIDRRGFALAPLVSRPTTRGRELVAGPWRRLASEGPARTPPREAGIILGVRSERLATPDDLLRTWSPVPAQRLVGILLDPVDRARFAIGLWEHGLWGRVDEVRWIGPRLPRLPEPRTTVGDDPRDSRTAGALRALAPRLGTLSVVLVGAGRGASELARQLVAVGVRRLTILDHDHVGPENLDAMPHAAPRDIGRPKGVVLARALRRNQPGLTVSCLNDSVVTATALRYLARSRADTVFSFVDDDAARLAVGWQCQQGCLVHVDVGTLIRHDAAGQRDMRGDVRLFEPRGGCVACTPPMPRLSEALYALSAPDGALHRGTPTAWEAERSGSLHHWNAVASGVAVEVWLGYLAGTITTSHWTRLRATEGAALRIDGAAVQGAPDCPFCHPELQEVLA